MAQYGTLGTYQLQNAAEDIRGSHLYGLDDEKLGKITDVVFSNGTGDILYVVVDTGGWLSTKEFIVPAERVRVSSKHENDFEVALTKSQVETFPPYNSKDVEKDEDWGEYENRYRSKWVTGPVMHREATDHNITPTPQQITQGTGATGGSRAAFGASPDLAADAAAADDPDTDSGRIIPAGSDAVVIDNGPSGIGGRWDTFQSRLRERRKQSAFGTKSVGGESASDLRKAV